MVRVSVGRVGGGALSMSPPPHRTGYLLMSYDIIELTVFSLLLPPGNKPPACFAAVKSVCRSSLLLRSNVL